MYERASRIAYYIRQELRHNPYFGPSPHCTLSLSLSLSGINFYVTSSHKFRFSDEGHLLQRGAREEEREEGRRGQMGDGFIIERGEDLGLTTPV